MKAALLFLTIFCAAVLRATVPATTTDDTNSRQKAAETDPQGRGRAAATKPKRESVPLPKPVNPHRLTNNSKDLASGKASNAQRQHLEPRNNLTKAGLGGHRSSLQRNSLRPSTFPRPTAPTPNNSRHHGPNAAVIGGPKNTTVTNTATLSGRALHGRP